MSKIVADAFHKLFYDSCAWYSTKWLGVTMLKSPFDIWVYQEILYDVRPSLIIETGTLHGGSALFLASVCDCLGAGHVVTVDIETRERRKHPRISYVKGSSTDPVIIEQLAKMAKNKKTLVVLDSDHHKDHVLQEMLAYGPMVAHGSYMIVEDGNINGHPVVPGWDAGPTEAIDEFLKSHPEFTADRDREKFLMTFNPGGYLRKK